MGKRWATNRLALDTHSGQCVVTQCIKVMDE